MLIFHFSIITVDCAANVLLNLLWRQLQGTNQNRVWSKDVMTPTGKPVGNENSFLGQQNKERCKTFFKLYECGMCSRFSYVLIVDGFQLPCQLLCGKPCLWIRYLQTSFWLKSAAFHISFSPHTSACPRINMLCEHRTKETSLKLRLMGEGWSRAPTLPHIWVHSNGHQHIHRITKWLRLEERLVPTLCSVKDT